MEGSVWMGVVAAGVLPLIEYRYQWGADVDQEFHDEATSRSVEVAMVVSQIMSRHGVGLPDADATLAAFLDREGRQCPAWTRWSLAELPGPRFGVVAPHGVVESNGEALVLVESPEPSRYSGFWRVPGVRYPLRTDRQEAGGHVVNQ